MSALVDALCAPTGDAAALIYDTFNAASFLFDGPAAAAALYDGAGIVECPPPPPAQQQQQQQQAAEAAGETQAATSSAPTRVRKRRRRARSCKSREETETQRMTHIAVERNRRRQMNEYLAVLRSHMPPSYAHRVRLRPVSSNLRSIDHCHSATTISIAHRYQLNSLVTFCNAVTAVQRFWFLFTG